MVFKYYSFEIVPWGAVLNIKGISSNRSINVVDVYNKNNGKYTTIKKALGEDRSFFVVSKKEPVKITYSVSRVNGELVEIETNLNVSEIYRDPDDGHIEEFSLDNEEWFNKPFETETITIEKVTESNEIQHRGVISSKNSGKEIEECIDNNGNFVLYKRDHEYIYLDTDKYDNVKNGIIIHFEKEKPYIKLCCNKVKIETILGDSNNGWSCDFEKLTVDSNYIYPECATKPNISKSKFSRYAIISWNKEETQQLYFGEIKGNSGRFWAISGGSGSSDYELLNYTYYHDTNKLIVTIPAIKTLINPCYYVVCTVNIEGCLWNGKINKYIKSGFTEYTYYGYLKYVKNLSENKYYISCDDNYIPQLFSLDKWGDNNSFYSIRNDYDSYYINPSDGVRLYTDWEGSGSSDGCCESADGCCEPADGCCQGDGDCCESGGDGCCQGDGDCCQGGGGETVTIPARRQLYGQWGTDCTEVYQSGGTWQQGGEIFVVEGSYPLVERTEYGWDIFSYNGGYAKYP